MGDEIWRPISEFGNFDGRKVWIAQRIDTTPGNIFNPRHAKKGCRASARYRRTNVDR